MNIALSQHKAVISLVLMCLFASFGPRAQGARPESLGRPACRALLPKSSEVEAGLLGYIEELLEQHILELSDLERMASRLSEGQLENPFTEAAAAKNSTIKVHRANLQKHLSDPLLRMSSVQLWVNAKIQELRVQGSEKKKAQEETLIPYQKIQFLSLKARNIQVKTAEGEVRNFSHKFEMTSTPVTQHQYFELMKSNPSFNSKGLESYIEKVNGVAVSVNPDHPVERVSLWAAMEFANRLSRQKGYPEVYDLTDLKLIDPDGDGNLQFDPSSQGLIKINAPEGNIYKARGFRLPTEEEVELLRKGMEFAPLSVDDYLDYGWFIYNSDFTTHPVGEKAEWSIDGQGFLDILGNVTFWGSPRFQRGIYVAEQFGLSMEGAPEQAIFSPGEVSDALFRGSAVSGNEKDFTNGIRLVRSLFDE